MRMILEILEKNLGMIVDLFSKSKPVKNKLFQSILFILLKVFGHIWSVSQVEL